VTLIASTVFAAGLFIGAVVGVYFLQGAHHCSSHQSASIAA
jgi:hypothetical protein